MQELRAGDPRQVGRYRIVARLGHGGMGVVFLGRSPGGRWVAIKVVRQELADDPEFRARFSREVAMAQRVGGTFTAPVLDADPDSELAWFATTYVQGLSLHEAIDEHGAWPVGAVTTLGAGTEALEAIHAAGVVHRDLKPSNVLLGMDGPRVIDFGISIAGDSSRLTSTGLAMGTPGFMSPEQLAGRRVGPPTDVFSLGVVLTYAISGNTPFGAGEAQAVNYRIAHEQPNLSLVPDELRPVVDDCLAKQPEDRPTIEQLLTRLATTEQHASSAAQAPISTDWLPETVARTITARITAPPPTQAEPSTPSGPMTSPGPAASETGTPEQAVTKSARMTTSSPDTNLGPPSGQTNGHKLGRLALLGTGAVGISVGIVWLAVSSVTGDDDDPTSSNSDPSRDSETGELLEPTELNVFDLRVGDCLDSFVAGTDVSAIQAVPCSEPHSDEVYLSVQMDDGEFPGVEAAGEFADQVCGEGFAEFVGIPWAASELDFGYLNPTEASWADGDREVLCTITDPATPDITGTLADVSR